MFDDMSISKFAGNVKNKIYIKGGINMQRKDDMRKGGTKKGPVAPQRGRDRAPQGDRERRPQSAPSKGRRKEPGHGPQGGPPPRETHHRPGRGPQGGPPPGGRYHGPGRGPQGGPPLRGHRPRRRATVGAYIAVIIIIMAIWCIANYPKLKENWDNYKNGGNQTESQAEANGILEDASQIEGEAYWVVNNNQPYFTDEEKQQTEAFEEYSELDELGRCGVAYANICIELMPTEERGEIGHIKPSGWHTVKYDSVDGKYLYNRCHLIGFQLAGENANKLNLITGTRYFNTEGMLPFENMVDDYVERTENHVLYRVSPIYEGQNLVASGVQIEAWSVEDAGEGICFCVYIPNVQPGITIDYATGESKEK